jgi:hypothetical protein
MRRYHHEQEDIKIKLKRNKIVSFQTISSFKKLIIIKKQIR